MNWIFHIIRKVNLIDFITFRGNTFEMNVDEMMELQAPSLGFEAHMHRFPVKS